MKTPEEIATALMRALSDDPKDWDFHELIVTGINLDRAQQEKPTGNPTLRAIEIIHQNYGPEGDPEVYAEAKGYADAYSGEVDAKYLIGAALALGHLDSDGILAMLRAAAE